jgi:hypothetical protein
MSTTLRQDTYRNAIALCHEYPNANGVVYKNERDFGHDRVYVRIRNPFRGLLAEKLIRDHRFLIAAQSRRYDDGTLVLFA